MSIKKNKFGYAIHSSDHIYYWCLLCDLFTGSCRIGTIKSSKSNPNRSHYTMHFNNMKKRNDSIEK